MTFFRAAATEPACVYTVLLLHWAGAVRVFKSQWLINLPSFTQTLDHTSLWCESTFQLRAYQTLTADDIINTRHRPLQIYGKHCHIFCYSPIKECESERLIPLLLFFIKGMPQQLQSNRQISWLYAMFSCFINIFKRTHRWRQNVFFLVTQF